MKQKIEVADMWCRIETMKWREPFGRQRSCVVCRDMFEVGDGIVLFVNNNLFFPNCMAHQFCVMHLGGLEAAVVHLQAQYKKGKQLVQDAAKVWPLKDLWHEAP